MSTGMVTMCLPKRADPVTTARCPWCGKLPVISRSTNSAVHRTRIGCITARCPVKPQLNLRVPQARAIARWNKHGVYQLSNPGERFVPPCTPRRG